jgi:acylphosphatase
MDDVVRRRVVISGRVQGVWFRDTLRRRAEQRGVAGWARNTSSGTVEALLEGSPDAVDEVVAWCWIGPPDAHVDNVEITAEEPEQLTGFEVRW